MSEQYKYHPAVIVPHPSGDPQKIIVRGAILSFPALFEPKAGPGGKSPKFGGTFVLPKGTDLTVAKRALLVAPQKKWGVTPEKAAEIIRSQRNPVFRDDQNEKYGYPEGSVTIRARSSTRPGVVSNFKGPDNKPLLITNPEEIYSGAIVAVSLFAGAYDVEGSKGVTFYLNNVQLLDKNAPRLDGRIAAADEFEATEELPDLGDMEAAAAGASASRDDLLGLL